MEAENPKELASSLDNLTLDLNLSYSSLHIRRHPLVPTSLASSAQACVVLAMVHKGPMQHRGQEMVSAFCSPPLSLEN